MFNEKEQELLNAADSLRRSIETLQCSHYYPLIGINNLYFLNIYHYIQHASFEQLKQLQYVDDQALKHTMIESCHAFCANERQSAPFSYETKNAAFLNNMAQILNTPFFEKEIDRPCHDPAMVFTKVLWGNYKTNWYNQQK